MTTPTSAAKPYPSMSKKEFVTICQNNGIKGALFDLNTNRPHLCYSGTYGDRKGEWEVLYRPDLWDEVNLRYLPPWKVTVSFGYLSGYNCAYHQNSLEECLQILVAGIPMKRIE